MKPPNKKNLQAAVDAAWRLVETNGLRKEAFDAATLDAIQDALWLLANGFPVKEVVATMNKGPKGGARQLAAIRKKRETCADEAVERKLCAAHLATVLSKLDLGALLGELGAVALCDDVTRAKRVFLAALRVWLIADKRGPELMKATVQDLKPSERSALFVRTGELQEILQNLSK